MKNRLEVARDLLSEDGVIFVQCDDNEQAYIFLPEGVIISYVSFSVTLLTVKSLEVQTPLVSLSKFL
jgi:adenine-specific DNA-methyltransferase